VLALAAGIVIGAVMLPKSAETPAQAPPPVPVKRAEAVPPAVTAVPEPVASLAAKPVPPARLRKPVARRPVMPDDGFLRLDNEWFETGVVLRVALGPNEVPADVMFGSDGRAHAIRLVSYK
jgi:hypothetical protein